MNSNAHEYKVNATKVALHLLREPDIFATNMKLFCAKDLEEAFIAGAEWQLQQLSHPDPPGEQGADGTIIIKEVMKEKAIEAFNKAMIFYISAVCPTPEEALKHFIACLDQESESGCSEKPNDQICGDCDAYCECQMVGAEHNDAACSGFDDSVLSHKIERN